MHPRTAWWLCIALAAGMAGCGRAQDPRPASPVPAEAQGDALLQSGDVLVRASVVQASSLPASVARQYDVERVPEMLLLLVVANKGPPESAVSIPVKVTTRVTDLRGSEQRVPMREFREGDAIDSIGTLRTSLPETLRFDLEVRVEGKPAEEMEFVREFYPQ